MKMNGLNLLESLLQTAILKTAGLGRQTMIPLIERMIETMRRRKLLFFSLILATLAIGVVIGTVVNRSVNADKPGIAPGATARDVIRIVMAGSVPVGAAV